MPPSLDELLQRAADNAIARHAQYLDAIAISAEAVDMGPGAVRHVASHLLYGANTVRKLAAMRRLEPGLVHLDVKPGTYWVFFLYAFDPYAELEEALKHGVDTPAKAKEWLGIEESRRIRKPTAGAQIVSREPESCMVTLDTEEPLPDDVRDVELSWERR